MSFSEAIKGARVELAGLPSFSQKAARAIKLAGILGSEALGTVAMAPYGLKAALLHRSLPSLDEYSSSSHESVFLARDVRYGAAPRNVMDIYLPRQAAAAHQTGGSSCRLPVVLFCHGGIWAAGAKWHYSPMGSSLAQLGVVAVMMQYTLYPDALVPQLVQELDQCLAWVQRHIHQMGGDSAQLSLVGHSAGAHLCALALLDRARALHQRRQQPRPVAAGAEAAAAREVPWSHKQMVPSSTAASRNASSDVGSSSSAAAPAAAWVDPSATAAAPSSTNACTSTSSSGGTSAHDSSACTTGTVRLLNMPARFVGLAGVYDICQHYEYERQRGVHEISTLKRAMGGALGFASLSPAVLLREALAAERKGQQQGQGQASCAGAAEQQLHGEAVVARAGLDRHLPPIFATSTTTSSSSSMSGGIGGVIGGLDDSGSNGSSKSRGRGSGDTHSSFNGANIPCPGTTPATAALKAKVAAEQPQPPLPAAAARLLPPTVLMSSCDDVTVPWLESAEMYWRLHDAGAPVQHLMYQRFGHGDFVTQWPGSRELSDPEGEGACTASSSGDSSSRTSSICHDVLLQRLVPPVQDFLHVVKGGRRVRYACAGLPSARL